MRAIGVDLAWGMTARTGLAEVDENGRLTRSTSTVSDDDIVAFILDGDSSPSVVAFDAPLIVTNPTGQRVCERLVGQHFGRYGASAHPTNLSRPHCNPQPRALRLARRLGLSVDPSTRPTDDHGVAIEVYPHPAMVVRFALSTVIPYKNKQGRTVPLRQVAFAQLFDAMERHLDDTMRLRDNVRWHQLREVSEDAPRHVDLDRIEDEIDAIFCAHLAWQWATNPGSLVVLGDVDAGYIVTFPPPSRV